MRTGRTLASLACLSLLGALAPSVAAALPARFTDTAAIEGLKLPTSVDFSSDGRVFVAEKSGLIKVFDDLSDGTPTLFADLRTETYNGGNSGLLGLALDPEFPTRPYVYVSYAYDAEIGGTAPRWGTAGQTSDPCPAPPGPTADGCVASGRLSRLTADGNTMISESVLINDWCQQFWDHSIGDIAFGADGSLYMSGGDGAAISFTDYGQRGIPLNPCGDPPSGIGGVQTAPTSEGGALRSQDYRTTGDPLGLSGSLIRVDPDTGRPIPDLPGELDQSVLNEQRVVAYGFRNPFRIAVRPGTNEVWVGDVGWSNWEEINRVEPGTTADFGWPCFEGSSLQPQGYLSLGLNICSDLYTDGDHAQPYFSYEHGKKVTPNETCATEESSAISGVEFYESGLGSASFPTSYDKGLFFADFVRSCIWVMKAGPDGLPDPSRVTVFDEMPSSGAVDLELGPDGALYYVGMAFGEIRRIAYENEDPLPRIKTPSAPAHFSAGKRISFSGSAKDPEDGQLPASALSWRLVRADCDDQGCPELPIDASEGDEGDFVAPSRPFSGPIKLELTAFDSAGGSATVKRKLKPRTVSLMVDSRRDGARVSISNADGRVPLAMDVLRDASPQIGTPARQHVRGYGRGTKLEWRRWSDGGKRIHRVSAKRDRTYTAEYKLRKRRG